MIRGIEDAVMPGKLGALIDIDAHDLGQSAHRILPNSLNSGSSIRQGPHHSAPNFTTTKSGCATTAYPNQGSSGGAVS